LNGNVKIIAEAHEEDLEKFINAINIKNTLINVADIKKEYSEPSGEYENFYKLVSEGESDKRLDTAALLLFLLLIFYITGYKNELMKC
jgi:hydrogenase maturation factor HypF (carbamoyltransferase family)